MEKIAQIANETSASVTSVSTSFAELMSVAQQLQENAGELEVS